MKATLSFFVSLVFACTSSFATDTNYPKTLAELNAWYVEPPAGSNAATLYLQGCAALKITDADTNSAELPGIGIGAFPSLDKPILANMKSSISEFAQRNQSAFSFFEKGARFNQARYPIDITKGFKLTFPHLVQIRRGVRALALDALCHAEANQGSRAGQAVLTSLALAPSLEADLVFSVINPPKQSR